MSKEFGRKKLNIVRTVMNSMMAGMAVQLVQKAFDALTNPCSLRSLRAVIQPCLWFNPVVIPFRVLLQQSDDLVSL